MTKSKPVAPLIARPDLCVIGASPAGLSIVAAACLMEIPVVLVHDESLLVGQGSQAASFLRATANRFQALQNDPVLSVAGSSGDQEIDFTALRAGMRLAVDAHAPAGSLVRHRAMGARVVEGEAHFIDPHTLKVGSEAINARRFIVASGSRPMIPQVPGIADVGYLTEDDLTDLDGFPEHLLIIGGSAESVALAQTFRRLGSEVTLLSESAGFLPAEDPEMAAIVEKALRRDGVQVRLSAQIRSLERGEDGRILARMGETERPVVATHLCVATQRFPVLGGLGLDRAKIETTPAGIVVNRQLRTSNARVYAVGGAIGDAPEAETVQAQTAFRNAVFRLPSRFDPAVIPRLVNSDPEMASVGSTEQVARRKRGGIRILRAPFVDNARSVAAGMTSGHIKAVVTPSGRILGCSIVGPRAHEAIQLWAYAMAHGKSVGSLAGLSVSGVVVSEVTRDAARVFVRQAAQTPWLRQALGFMRRWG